MTGFGFEQRPGTDDWWTPPWLFEAMDTRFALDPCPGAAGTPARAWCYENLEGNGLEQSWHGLVWLNPPYSGMDAWMARMIAHNHGVALTYARTDRQWCQDAMRNAGACLFLRKRVRFLPGAGQHVSSPGAPSMMFGFGAMGTALLYRLADKGHGVIR